MKAPLKIQFNGTEYIKEFFKVPFYLFDVLHNHLIGGGFRQMENVLQIPEVSNNWKFKLAREKFSGFHEKFKS